MGKKLLFLFISICSLFLFSEDKKLEEISLNIIFNLIGNRYEEIFKNFYIPANYEEKNLKNDEEAITKGLEFIIEKLGQIKNFSPINTMREEVISFYLSPGPFEELNLLKNFFTLYKINFERFGIGYILLEFVEIDKKYFLKKITFSFPSQNEKSISISKEIQKFFIDLIYKQSEREKK